MIDVYGSVTKEQQKKVSAADEGGSEYGPAAASGAGKDTASPLF